MLYYYPDFPIPTQSVIDAVANMQSQIDRLLAVKRKVEPTSVSAHWLVLKAPKTVVDWASQEFSNQYHVAVQVFAGDSYFLPHIDRGRSKVFNFLVDTGGDNVKTCFWKLKPEFSSHLVDNSRKGFEYNTIDLVESVVFKPGQWWNIDVSQIHSVEGLDPSRKRISLTLHPQTDGVSIADQFVSRLSKPKVT